MPIIHLGEAIVGATLVGQYQEVVQNIAKEKQV
jgi:hypothetical protein